MDVKPVTHVTVADQVMAQLGDLILTGQLKPGDKLPNERRLSAMFGTTRARIREVLRSLVLIGLIETRMGDGSYVSTANNIPHEAIGLMFFRERSKYDQLYMARKVLEPPVFVLAAELITPAQIQRLEDIVATCEQSLAYGGSAEDFLALITEYDAIIVESTGNSILIALMAIFRNMSHEAYLTLLRVPDSA
ncbi:MAG: GntR family transcriptional regulator [Firmicutes bacterium]|nr:GntR family transcriptional regulator [Bacillota bacterium]